MTRETKIGLLVSMGVIILMGVLISDYLSVAQSTQAPVQINEHTNIQAPLNPDDPALRGTPYTPQALPPSTPEGDPAPIEHQQPQPLPQEPREVHNVPEGMIPAEQRGRIGGLRPDLERQQPQPRPDVQPEPREQPEIQITPQHPPRPQMTIHTVASNDNLTRISEKYYGTGRYFYRIFEANKDQLSSSDDYLQVGMKLKVPNAQRVVVRPVSNETGVDMNRYQYYTIKPNDSLWTIAKEFYGTGTKHGELYRLNKHRLRSSTLPVGKKILVPKK